MRLTYWCTSIHPQKASLRGGFQEYTLLDEGLVAPIPECMTFETAAVIPTGLFTASSGLCQKEYLKLLLTSLPPLSMKHQFIVIWSGPTSVGRNAIQLAVAPGCQVITTASPQRYELIRSLGATPAFDYRISVTEIEDITAALEGKTFVGALASEPVC